MVSDASSAWYRHNSGHNLSLRRYDVYKAYVVLWSQYFEYLSCLRFEPEQHQTSEYFPSTVLLEALYLAVNFDEDEERLLLIESFSWMIDAGADLYEIEHVSAVADLEDVLEFFPDKLISPTTMAIRCGSHFKQVWDTALRKSGHKPREEIKRRKEEWGLSYICNLPIIWLNL